MRGENSSGVYVASGHLVGKPVKQDNFMLARFDAGSADKILRHLFGWLRVKQIINKSNAQQKFILRGDNRVNNINAERCDCQNSQKPLQIIHAEIFHFVFKGF